MSARSAVYLGCDACGNPSEVVTTGIKDARAVAAAQGWTRPALSLAGMRRLYDICPRHTGETPERLVALVRAWRYGVAS